MRIDLFILTLTYLLTACNAKDNTLNNKQTNTINLKNANDSVPKNNIEYFNDGWPEGIPRDTAPNIPLKSYSPMIKVAILESAPKRNNFPKMEINLLEVYRCRAWDGEKWYTTKNDYSVLVCDKISPDNSRWIVPVECINGKYITQEWIGK